MDDFLKGTKSCLKEAAQSDKKIHIVIGNESCDLDSVIAALTYSYFLLKTSVLDTVQCLPVLNIPRSQFHLRTDSKYLLNQTGINPDHLTFRDDLDLHDLHQIDHHRLERKTSDKVKVIVDLVGSCCSLVAGMLLDSPEFPLCPQLVTMLIGAILVDTVNTSPEAGKTTPYDRKILDRLIALVPDLDTKKLYNDILLAKNDVSSLTRQEILEKDLKRVIHGNKTVVMSSISVPLQTFLQDSDVKLALESVLHDQNGQSLVVMTMDLETGIPHREILVYSNSEKETTELAEFLKTNNEAQLDLQPLTCDLQYSLAYCQGNIKASRKIVLPLVKLFLEKTSSSVHVPINNSQQ